MKIVMECRRERNFLIWVKEESRLPSERKRASILLACTAGLTQRAIAEIVGCARATVVRTYRRWREEGRWALVDKRRFGRTEHPIDDILELLPQLCADQPREYGWGRSRWTIEMLSLEVGRQLDCEVSPSQMHRYLKEAECRWKRPKPTVAKRPDDADEQLEDLRSKLWRVDPNDVVLYADEMKLELNPKTGAAWMPPGIRKELVTPGWNPTRYIAGAYNPKTDHLVWAMADSNDSDLFELLTRIVADRYRGWHTVHMVVDNYSVHTSNQTEQVLEELGGKIELEFLPPYCPEANPIERVWWDVHDNVTRNHRCDDLDELSLRAYRYLDTRAYDGAAVAGLRRCAP